jgi:hypothetical protein
MPRKKSGYSNPAESFRRAQRHLTWRRPRRRIRTKVVGGVLRPSFRRAGKRLLRTRVKVVRIIENIPSRLSSSTAPGGGDRAGGITTSTPSDAGDANDVSVEFRSEMAALLAFYAVRIGAARRSLDRTTADLIILAIMGEQTVAVRALTDRWHAASEKQRAERLERPSGSTQRKDDDAKPS